MPPDDLDITSFKLNLEEKRYKYFSDPTRVEPIMYTPDEVRVARYLCEIGEFRCIDFLGYPNYAVSPDGRLLNLRTKNITTGSKKSTGYVMFSMNDSNGKSIQNFVHVIIANAFLGPPPTALHKTVDHMDIDCSNNYFYNLRWATMKQQAVNKTVSLKPRRGRPVTQIHSQTYVEIFTWFREDYAAEYYGLAAGSIGKAVSTKSVTAGYRWIHANNLIVDSTGTVEEWKTIKVGDSQINVSSFGRICTYRAGFWYGHKGPDGRRYVGVKIKTGVWKVKFVHRLVAKAYIGEPPSKDMYCVDHIDGNPLNNKVSNLRYITVADNNRHMHVTGNVKSTINGSNSKPVVQLSLNNEFIEEYPSISEAKRLKGYSADQIEKVVSGKGKTANGFKWVSSAVYFRS